VFDRVMSECVEQCVAEDNAQKRADESKRTSGRGVENRRHAGPRGRCANTKNYFPAIEQPASWLFRHNGTFTCRSQPRAAAGHRAPALYTGVIGGSILIGGYYDFN
jgi:hypothetical protein